MTKYSPVRGYADGDDFRFDYSSQFEWAHGGDSCKRYKSIYTYNVASLTLDVEHLTEEERTDYFATRMAHHFIVVCCYLFAVLTSPFSVWFVVKRIAQNERAILFRLGRLQKVRGPGLTCFLPWIDKWKKIDLRMRAFVIPPQQLIMADGAIVEVGCEIRFRVCDVIKSVTAVKNLDRSMRLLGQTSMVSILQSKNLTEIHGEKLSIASKLQADLNSATQPWGIEISLVEFSTVKVLQEGATKPPLESILSSFHSTLQTENSHTICETKQTNTLGMDVITVMRQKVFPVLDNSGQQKREAGIICKLDIVGNEGGVFWLDTKTGKMSEEDAPTGWKLPDVTVKLSDADFLQFVNGQLSPLNAYMCGRLEVTGDAKHLGEIQNLLKMQ